MNNYGKFHKGYTTTKVYSTNNPKITRSFVYGVCLIFMIIGVICLLLKNYLTFILMIISILFIFVFKSFLGTILSIVTLILSIINLKHKFILNIIALIGSIILVLISIISFFISFNVVNGVLTDVKRSAMENTESVLENYALTKVREEEQECEELNKNSDEIIACAFNEETYNIKDLVDIKEYNLKENNCKGYVEVRYDELSWKAEAYLSCDNYKTSGYNDNY